MWKHRSWWLTLATMRKSKFGELVLDTDDLCNAIMQGRDVLALKSLVVEPTVHHEQTAARLLEAGQIMTWTLPESADIDLADFDRARQQRWFMPQSYADIDIAEHVLSLCQTQAQLQRVGQELLMYQERDLFDLLRYLKYLVDTMTAHGVIWGVGRGSSVSSYVLFLLGVHRIDSLYYELDPGEFLR